MLRVALNCYGNYTTDSVYQWDQNHVLTLTGNNINDISAIHFCNKKCDNARVVSVTRGSGEISAPIPNELLEMPYDVIAYVHSIDNNQAKTIEIINIPVIKRVKPDDYEFVENVDIVNFERLESDIQDFISSITNQQNNFEINFMTEYNNRVASGYFLGPDGATELKDRLDRLETDTDARLDRLETDTDARLDLLEQQIIDVDALNDVNGDPVLLTDSAEGVLSDILISGKHTQNGEPTPNTPIDIDSVGGHGWFDGKLLLGCYQHENNGIYSKNFIYVCNRNPIPCKSGDIIKFRYIAETLHSLMILFYDENMNFLSFERSTTDNILTVTAPNTASYFNINVKFDEVNTLDNVKKIIVTINDTYALQIKRVEKNLWEYGDQSFSHRTEENVYLPKGTYTFSATVTSSDTDTTLSRVFFFDKDHQTIKYGDLTRNERSSFTVTLDRETVSVRLYSALYDEVSLTDTATYTGIQLEPGNIMTDYESYREENKYITLTEPMKGTDDLKDVTNLITITRKLGEIEYDGSIDEAWTYEQYGNYYRFRISNPPNCKESATRVMCSHFKYKKHIQTSTDLDGTLYVGTSKINLINSSITSLDEWRNWLQANPIRFVYELAEPTVENLEEIEIVTKNNITYLIATDRAPMWVEYYSNSPIGKRLANTNEEMKAEHDIFSATLGYTTTEKNKLPGCMFTENQTISGVDVVVNDDNSFTLNGTATEDINKSLAPNVIWEDGVEYILSGCPSGGSVDTFSLSALDYDGSTIEVYDTGDGVKFRGADMSSGVYLKIKAGVSFNNVTFKPMIRLATIEDDTYEPYGLNVKNKFKEIDSRTARVYGYKNTIEVSANDTVVRFEYPNGFKHNNSIVLGVSVGYWQNDYSSPAKYTSDAVVELTDANINLYVKGNSFSKYVTTNIVLFKIA